MIVGIASEKEFLDSLIFGDRAMCLDYAQKYLKHNSSIIELYEDVFKKSLYEVGELWELNKISVASEHLSSAIIESMLNEYYAEITSVNKINKTVVIACVEDEYHQIGAKMINDVFELNGWNSFFLGANTPSNELISFLKNIKPELLAISVSLYFHIPKLEIMIQQIRKELPELVVLVGGQAFSNGGSEVLSKYDHVIYQPDLKSTDLFIKNYAL
jgi:MerR family transcriptional regulator, light-induced transcriptional regulator